MHPGFHKSKLRTHMAGEMENPRCARFFPWKGTISWKLIHHVPHTFLFPFWIEVHSSKMPIVSATGKRTSMWPYDPASFVRTINSCQMVLYALLQRIICSNHTWSSVVDSTLSCIDSKGRWLVLSNIDIFYVNTTILRLPKIFSWVTKVQGGGIP